MAKSLRDILKKKVMKDITRRAESTGTAGEIWDAIVPEKYREHTKATGYKRRILDVVADSPVVLGEIEGFYRHEKNIEEKTITKFQARTTPTRTISSSVSRTKPYFLGHRKR